MHTDTGCHAFPHRLSRFLTQVVTLSILRPFVDWVSSHPYIPYKPYKGYGGGAGRLSWGPTRRARETKSSRRKTPGAADRLALVKQPGPGKENKSSRRKPGRRGRSTRAAGGVIVARRTNVCRRTVVRPWTRAVFLAPVGTDTTRAERIAVRAVPGPAGAVSGQGCRWYAG